MEFELQCNRVWWNTSFHNPSDPALLVMRQQSKLFSTVCPKWAHCLWMTFSILDYSNDLNEKKIQYIPMAILSWLKSAIKYWIKYWKKGETKQKNTNQAICTTKNLFRVRYKLKTISHTPVFVHHSHPDGLIEYIYIFGGEIMRVLYSVYTKYNKHIYSLWPLAIHTYI